MEERHLGLSPDEQSLERAIVARLEQDVSSVVGQTLCAEGGGWQGDAP